MSQDINFPSLLERTIMTEQILERATGCRMFISISSHKWNNGFQSFPFHLISASKWEKLKSTRGGWVLMAISSCVAHYLFLSAQQIIFPINISTSRRMWWEARGPARIQTCCHKLVSHWLSWSLTQLWVSSYTSQKTGGQQDTFRCSCAPWPGSLTHRDGGETWLPSLHPDSRNETRHLPAAAGDKWK